MSPNHSIQHQALPSSEYGHSTAKGGYLYTLICTLTCITLHAHLYTHLYCVTRSFVHSPVLRYMLISTLTCIRYMLSCTLTGITLHVHVDTPPSPCPPFPHSKAVKCNVKAIAACHSALSL